MRQYIAELSTLSIWKFILLLGAFFRPIQEEIYVITALICVDFFSGAWKSIRIHQSFNSRKMGNSVGKIVLYILAVLSCYAVDLWILEEPTPWLSKGVAGFIAATELVSIAENIDASTGLNLKDFLGNLLKRKQ